MISYFYSHLCRVVAQLYFHGLIGSLIPVLPFASTQTVFCALPISKMSPFLSLEAQAFLTFRHRQQSEM